MVLILLPPHVSPDGHLVFVSFIVSHSNPPLPERINYFVNWLTNEIEMLWN